MWMSSSRYDVDTVAGTSEWRAEDRSLDLYDILAWGCHCEPDIFRMHHIVMCTNNTSKQRVCWPLYSEGGGGVSVMGASVDSFCGGPFCILRRRLTSTTRCSPSDASLASSSASWDTHHLNPSWCLKCSCTGPVPNLRNGCMPTVSW